MFDTTELQVLVGIQRGKTLTQIGDELSLSHPTVSKMLRAAEHKAGLRLTEQQGRRLRLTADGARLADAAREALLKMRELDSTLAHIKSGEGGSLRILASNRVCSYVLPPVINELLSSVHDVDVHIQGADVNPDIWDVFDSRNFDVGIARTPPPPPTTAVHLFDDELCLCVSTQSEFAGRTHIDWPELSRCTLVGPYADNAMWRQLSMLGIQPRRRIYVSNAVLATRFIADENALALLYRSVALDEVAQGRLSILGLPTPTTVPYWMATSIDAATSPLVQKFVTLLQSHVRSFGA